MKERLLIVASESECKELLALLRKCDYRLNHIDFDENADREVESLRPDLVFVELNSSNLGVAASTAAAVNRMSVPLILMTHTDDEVLLEQAASLLPAGFLMLPPEESQLNLMIRAALVGRTKYPRRVDPGDVLDSAFSLKQRYGIELTENMFDSISEGVLVTDVYGKVLYGNPASRLIFGDSDEGVDDWMEEYEFLHTDQKTPFPLLELPAVAAAQGKSPNNVEIYIRRRSQPKGKFVNVHGRPLYASDGSVVGAVTVGRDISDTKNAEAGLQESVARYQQQNQMMQTIFDSMSDGVIVVDSDGECLLFNKSAEQILGKRATASVDEQVETFGLYHTDETTPYSRHELPLSKALQNESTDGIDMIVRNEERPNGVRITVSGRPLHDLKGQPSGGTIVFRDVTEASLGWVQLEQTARLLDEQSQTMDAVFESISDGVLVFDTEGELLLANKGAHRIVGKDMLAKSDPSRWRKEHGLFLSDEETRLPPELYPHHRAIRGEPVDDLKMFVRNPKVPNGRHLSVDCRPMYNPARELTGAVLVARDETTSVRANQALTNAFVHGRLEVLDTIVHNIGNAINSVSVGINTLRDQVAGNVLVDRLSALASAIEAHRNDWRSYLEDDPQGKRVLPFILALAKDFERTNRADLKTIERVATRVSHIEKIVRTQTASDNGSVLRADINLNQSIEDACNILRESLESRDIKLSIDCARAPKEIRVQESSFHQLIVNLVKNALDAIDDLRQREKNSTAGVIRVAAFTRGDMFVVEVSDDGIGIEPSLFNQIFQAGYTTKTDGTGLGLHSAANYVNGSGGTILPWSSGLGHGTTMRVEWRIARVAVADS